MIDVSEVITDPDFAQAYVVHRRSDSWTAGRTLSSEAPIKMVGVITVADAKTLNQLPEGDRVTGLMCFYATKELFTTSDQGTSDQIEWRGERYRVKQVFPYGDYGYYKAIGERMAGD
ncbi:hypothetical protein P9G84_22375 [Brevibacillus centrosporus]|uniref:hypothetical protein n=1 Tax=Brevibacillus centrosporus TaxID=54910 RepID=UPI000F0A1074|nr:hypothetical protein [Brevibacillus centrosporus]MEC2131675.1 hypothetical protein [Brevibacillus centrosporus]RNB67325.1 hypothetical protein EDM55_19955 [Brevibacillus centrosporus]GED34030.1 hypothetical protein BCE02nite_51710 [Brevibacillus centrosporus]